jgi:hypothetical protein
MLLSIIFATIFLTINYLYSTFASPILSEGGVDAGESLNLVKYIPEDQKCDQASQWESRLCVTYNGDRSWLDVCRSNQGGDPHYMVDGSCRPNTICHPTIIQNADNPEPVDTIVCVPRASTKNVLSPNVQSGVYKVENGPGSSQHTISVILETNLPGATVAALMEGTY